MISVKLDVASVVDSRGGVHEYDGQIVSTWVCCKRGPQDFAVYL